MQWQQKSALLLCTLALGSSTLLASTVEAKKPHKVKPEKDAVTTITTTTTSIQTISLTTLQRTQIVEIIRGTSTSSYLINDVLRQQIYTQVGTLPPGIQKNLARGKGLPPGIAKKVLLPVTVVNYINLPANTNIIVVGSNVVVIDPIKNGILDIIANIL
ncbi:hypothetical protein APA_1996 [Pseudanabaena sp. lw0831]|uniref:hypothetical protein n=1 Tax=Pseudanabaena sp. lw0831 TaxID=1357935 RepID=UPI0019152637|nr:hypothetical protein [Pseudanabaena sp. lw0831]GBO54048.1 hypothetical protein APA_1996 [Pseudanabaena sp. lw0831]